MQYDNLPEVIREQDSLCVWKRIKRNGEWTKVPYQINGRRARADDPSTFTTYDRVAAIYAKGGYDGIGLLNNAFVGIDIDKCVNDDGTLSEMANDIVETIDSYTEYSPSGKGIRIWLSAPSFNYDRKKYFINNRKKHLEVYVPGETNRFLTLTGNVIRNNDVMERGQQLQAIIDKYMVRPSPKRTHGLDHAFCVRIKIYYGFYYHLTTMIC